MKKIGIAAVTALALAWGAPASADEGNTAKDDPNRVICKSDPSTGTRIRKSRKCMTKAQWDELADKTKQNIDDYSRLAGSKAPTGTNPFTGQ